jgi:methionyl-tRNA formyltransferase
MADREAPAMRIEFLTQEDSLYVLPFFDEFFRHYGGEFEVTRISCCRVMGKRHRKQLLQELSWLYGVFGLARLLLQAGTTKLLASFPRSRMAAQFYSIAQLARAYRIEYSRVGNPNHEDFIRGLQKRSPGLLVSVACPYILKQKVIEVPSQGCINIHHAPLPRYKGMMPTFWQLYHGERELGVTIHTMSAKVDEGEALLQESFPFERGESLHQLVRKTKRHGAHCVARVLRSLISNTAVPVRLDQAQGSYFTFPRREEALEFRRRGLRAI